MYQYHVPPPVVAITIPSGLLPAGVVVVHYSLYYYHTAGVLGRWPWPS